MDILWGIVGIVVPLLICLGVGFGVIEANAKEFQFARGCFTVSAVLMSGTTLYWELNTEMTSPYRIAVGLLVGFLVFVMFPESLRWINSKEKKVNVPQQESGSEVQNEKLTISNSVSYEEKKKKVTYNVTVANTGFVPLTLSKVELLVSPGSTPPKIKDSFNLLELTPVKDAPDLMQPSEKRDFKTEAFPYFEFDKIALNSQGKGTVVATTTRGAVFKQEIDLTPPELAISVIANMIAHGDQPDPPNPPQPSPKKKP